jgi:hypothetical protein
MRKRNTVRSGMSLRKLVIIFVLSEWYPLNGKSTIFSGIFTRYYVIGYRGMT